MRKVVILMSITIKGLNSSNYNFGSLSSIRKQAQAIQDRLDAESAARKEEQERTGLIRNPSTGEMLELSSVPEWQRERWEQREQANSVSPEEAMIGFMATAPHSEEIELDKQRAAVFTKIQNKMLTGKKLSGEEKKFLQEHYPAHAVRAEMIEAEAEQLERSLKNCKTKDEAQQVYMDAKTRAMGGSGRDDGSILLLLPALDNTYNEYLKQGTSGKKMNTWA